MSVVRSTGALIGTNESSGVSVAAGAFASPAAEVDLLGDATSLGTLSLYAVWTAAAGATGVIRVTLKRNRVTGQTYPSEEFWEFPASLSGGKKYLGMVPCGRYGQATLENRSSVALTNAAVLYELEKVS